MDSVPKTARGRELRSGGKIVRARRGAGSRTPYDRPGSQNSVPRNPNWISRFIYSPSRAIASNAGKLITSVFVSDSSDSGSSANASDAELDDEDEISNSPAGDEPLDKIGTSEMNNGGEKDPSPVFWRKETKRVIEQLILQETFSREECDRLTTAIKSRVVDLPIEVDDKEGRRNEFPDDVDMPELSSKAITEARKWLEEKRGSISNSKLNHGSYTPDSSMFPRTTVCEVGSPVYMAKSYMRTRPAWTSPSADAIEHRSPSPFGLQHFPQENFFSGAGISSSSSKLKGTQSARTWNLREELRRVRSKATEDLLKNLSSSMIDSSPFSSVHKHNIDRIVNDQVETGKEDQMHHVETCLDMDAGASSSFQVPKDMQNLQNEALANPVSPSSQCNQDIASDKAAEVTGDNAPTKADALGDSIAYNGNHSTSNEVTGTSVAVICNGYPSSEPSLSARPEPVPEPELEPEPEPEPRPIGEEIRSINQSHETEPESKHVEGDCVLLGESLLEKPIEDHNFTQKSSTTLDASDGDDTRVEKQVMNKTRKGRARGRGRGKSRGK